MGFLNGALFVLSGITGGTTESAVTAAAETTAAAPAGGLFGGGIDIFTILIYGGFIVLIYFFLFRGPRKEMKRKAEMRSKLGVGDSVIMSNGLFGKIVEIGTDSYVIEFGSNRGVRVPVLKEAVEGVREPVLAPMAAIEESK
jgi:preprotein translocase subunit YajC